MKTAALVLDIALASAAVATAVGVLAVRDRFTMIVVFVVFGLLTALAWVRLAAPDVALAEAAIGTGVTGALLLKTLYLLRGDTSVASPRPTGSVVVAALLTATVTGACITAFLASSQGATGLVDAVAQNLNDSGVENPVTAVLLNFRAFDTLMEVVVLLVAIVVVWSIERGPASAPAPALGDVFTGYARLVLPAAVVVGIYVVWVGATEPGGAFQGGAVLAAVGILLLFTRTWRPHPDHRVAARGAFAFGTAAFALVALGVGLADRATLEYPIEHAKTLIMAVEAALTVSIAATLAALFYGREPIALASKEQIR